MRSEWPEEPGRRPFPAGHPPGPERDAAWRHLGFKKQGNHWVKPELAAAARARAQEQQKADRHWKPILERYRSALQSKIASRRAEAQESLANINDPAAVPMVWATFGRGEPSMQNVAVQVLGQIDDGAASRSLVLLAVFGGTADVRGRAIATLRGRDAREFASMLIGMILEPIEYEVKKIQGPGQTGELLIKGQGSAPNLKRLYSPPGAPSITPQSGDRISLDAERTARHRPARAGYCADGIHPRPPRSSGRLTRTPAQVNQLMDMLAHSGLGAAGQKLGQTMIAAYNNSVHFVNHNIPLLVAESRSSRWPATTLVRRPDPRSAPRFPSRWRVSRRSPWGGWSLEAQKAAVAAEQQLENDVAAIKQYNRG